VEHDLALDKVVVDPSPLHDTLHFITLTFELVIFRANENSTVQPARFRLMWLIARG
jgi:hypothetical protein